LAYDVRSAALAPLDARTTAASTPADIVLNIVTSTGPHSRGRPQPPSEGIVQVIRLLAGFVRRATMVANGGAVRLAEQRKIGTFEDDLSRSVG
jgi:hypothetical protein